MYTELKGSYGLFITLTSRYSCSRHGDNILASFTLNPLHNTVNVYFFQNLLRRRGVLWRLVESQFLSQISPDGVQIPVS